MADRHQPPVALTPAAICEIKQRIKSFPNSRGGSPLAALIWLSEDQNPGVASQAAIAYYDHEDRSDLIGYLFNYGDLELAIVFGDEGRTAAYGKIIDFTDGKFVPIDVS